MLGDNIKKRREDLGLSQAQLAKRMGYKQSSIAKIETGVNGVPYAKIEKFAVCLGTTPSELIGWKTEAQKTTSPNKNPRAATLGFLVSTCDT